MAPMWLYFELADHPINKIKYTDKLEMIKKRRMLCLISYIGYILKVKSISINIAENKERAGVKYLKI